VADGTATVTATAVDAAGNEASASVSITVDNTPPQTDLLGAPPALTSARAASFSFSASEPAAFECSLDGATFGGCASPASYAGLSEGTHTFAVRAVDLVGNVDATPASARWTVDFSPPDTFLTAWPPALTNSTAATIAFTASENASFECALDGAAFTTCASPAGYSGLGEGEHAVAVRAVDAAGNVDTTPATGAWTIDLTPPETTIASGPSGTVADAEATFTFAAGEKASFECSLDGAAFGPCASPVAYFGLTGGGHLFLVRATDAAANVDATPAARAWTVLSPVSPLQPPPV
jgi:hypothetical protein